MIQQVLGLKAFVVLGLFFAFGFAAIKWISLCCKQVDISNTTATTVAQLCGDMTSGASIFYKSAFRHTWVYIVLVVGILLSSCLPQHGAYQCVALSTSYICGALVAMAVGYCGVRLTTSLAAQLAASSLEHCRTTNHRAVNGSQALGIGVVGIGVLMVFLFLYSWRMFLSSIIGLVDLVSAYGFGICSVALIWRLSGGIFRQTVMAAAEMTYQRRCSAGDMDPSNPSNLAVWIGCMVSTHTEMSLNILSTGALAICAAFTLGVTVADAHLDPMYFIGILVTGLCSTMVVATMWRNEDNSGAVHFHTVFSLITNSVLQLLMALWVIPPELHVHFLNGRSFLVLNWYCAIVVVMGLWCGYGMGNVMEHYTTDSHDPVKELAEICESGPSSAILAGLGLGHLSGLLPAYLMALTIYVAYNLCGILGIALAALGVLSSGATLLTASYYNLVVSTAAEITKRAPLAQAVKLQMLMARNANEDDATPEGQGMAFGASVLTSVALYGAFLVRCHPSLQHVLVNLVDPRIFFGLITGTLLPHMIHALVLKREVMATQVTRKEIQKQLRAMEFGSTVTPDHEQCVQVAVSASLQQILLIGALALAVPLATALLFGVEALSGMLPATIMSSLTLCLSLSVSGRAWGSARNYVEAGGLGTRRSRGSKEHSGALMCEAVGDPMQYVCYPLLEEAMKIIAVMCVVCVSMAANVGLLFDRLGADWASKDA